tara:strand:- start:5584 stop:6483 length:900 start_codon:yes stop_codon:yes gene_type:complete
MKQEEQHRLLKRQLKKAFGNAEPNMEQFDSFISLVNASYKNFDEEREIYSRAEEISNRELNEMNAQLQEKNTFLDSFNHGLAHDIKNHTANFKGLLSMFKKYYAKKDEQKVEVIIEKLDRSIGQMSYILDGFLYLSRAEGKLDLQYTEIDAFRLKEHIRIETEYLVSGSNHEVNCDFEVEGLFYSQHILRIILVNLISNSIKFRKPNENAIVNASITHNESTIFLKVKDNGIGMDMNDPELKVIKMFNREEKDPTVKGYGVGLFMVKKILDYNKGSIQINSQLNEGTEIVIELPKLTNP